MIVRVCDVFNVFDFENYKRLGGGLKMLKSCEWGARVLDTTENRQLSEITYIRTENTHAFPLPQNSLSPPLRHLSPFFHNFSLRFFICFMI